MCARSVSLSGDDVLSTLFMPVESKNSNVPEEKEPMMVRFDQDPSGAPVSPRDRDAESAASPADELG